MPSEVNTSSPRRGASPAILSRAKAKTASPGSMSFPGTLHRFESGVLLYEPHPDRFEHVEQGPRDAPVHNSPARRGSPVHFERNGRSSSPISTSSIIRMSPGMHREGKKLFFSHRVRAMSRTGRETRNADAYSISPNTGTVRRPIS